MQNSPFLERVFTDARREQLRQHGRPFTEFDKAVGNAVLQATLLAMEDVRLDRREKVFRPVTAPSGAGKTTSAAAAIAAGLHTVPDFSCAYVVETARQVDEVGTMIVELVGSDAVTAWSYVHDADKPGSRAASEAVADMGGRKMPLASKADLKTSRVVVTTHEQWRVEMSKGIDNGVRLFNGSPRSVVYVDEHPDLVKVIERTPGDFEKLRDRIFGVHPNHNFIPVLEMIRERAEIAFKSPGATYASVELISCLEAFQFYDLPSMELYADPGVSPYLAKMQREFMEGTVRFIVAAAKSCVFMSRSMGRPSLIAYEVEFEPGPGHVLLDATADITGMVALMGDMRSVDVPAVDFSNLKLFIISEPRGFKFKKKLANRKARAEEYVAWMRAAVIDNTEPGERVLVVTNKALLDRGYIDRAEDADTPLDWEGRMINTIHHGIGIGSNKYKNCDAVFSFGEHHRPRHAAISDVHGWTDETPTDTDLRDASKKKLHGGYLIAHEGHLLRHIKQEALRGNARNIDKDGRCGAMRFYQSGEVAFFLRHSPTLYPGTDAPILIDGRTEGTTTTKGGRAKYGVKVDALVKLIASDERDVIWSDEVQSETGIRADKLSEVIQKSPAVQTALAAYGRVLASAKDVGEKGKRRCVARKTSRFRAAA